MKFFKSVWFRCVATLLLIMLASGVAISVLSDVLYVSPDERTMRAIKKIYGSEVSYQTVFDVDSDKNDDYLLDSEKSLIFYGNEGRINKIYIVGDTSSSSYDLLFQSVGYQGYKGGSITVWVKVKVSTTYDIDKVVLAGYEKQTLMSKLGDSFYNGFKLNDIKGAYDNGNFFTANAGSQLSNPIAGATYSVNAGVNAVNCVIKYVGQGGITR